MYWDGHFDKVMWLIEILEYREKLRMCPLSEAFFLQKQPNPLQRKCYANENRWVESVDDLQRCSDVVQVSITASFDHNEYSKISTVVDGKSLFRSQIYFLSNYFQIYLQLFGIYYDGESDRYSWERRRDVGEVSWTKRISLFSWPFRAKENEQASRQLLRVLPEGDDVTWRHICTYDITHEISWRWCQNNTCHIDTRQLLSQSVLRKFTLIFYIKYMLESGVVKREKIISEPFELQSNKIFVGAEPQVETITPWQANCNNYTEVTIKGSDFSRKGKRIFEENSDMCTKDVVQK